MPDFMSDRPRFCSQCGQPVVVADANFCKECGAPLAGTEWFNKNITWRPFTALMLSVIPGLGQLYKGQGVRGFLWFSAVVLFYVSGSSFGLILHAVCAINAALSGAIREDALSRNGRRHANRRFAASPPNIWS
jgi:TM2 domain-containing membrane protein YozV